MATTVMTVKTDTTLKLKAQKLAEKLGLKLGTLINALLRQFVKDRAVHLTTEPAYRMNRALEKELEQVEKDIREGKNISPAFDNSKDLLHYLHHAKIE